MLKLTVLASVVVGCLAVVANGDERPNVILFIADDVSWNDYGCYGNEAARTPHIDRLAENGLRFTEAYLTASSCSPSRSSIVTGRYPHNNGKAAELHLPIHGDLPWFPTLLRDAGYYTAIVGKHHMKSAPGGKHSTDKPFDLVDGGPRARQLGRHAKWVQTVKERPQEKPFFLWFAAYDAHRGWDADKQWKADEYGPPARTRRCHRASVPVRRSRHTPGSGVVLQRSHSLRPLHRPSDSSSRRGRTRRQHAALCVGRQWPGRSREPRRVCTILECRPPWWLTGLKVSRRQPPRAASSAPSTWRPRFWKLLASSHRRRSRASVCSRSSQTRRLRFASTLLPNTTGTITKRTAAASARMGFLYLRNNRPYQAWQGPGRLRSLDLASATDRPA